MKFPLMLWRPRRDDLSPLLLLVLLPLLFAAPQWLGLVHADPALYDGDIGTHLRFGRFPGAPYVDPNNGFTAQALGTLAARLWVHGVVPWWNSYSGVGMPLAGEYQPAVFSPLSLLLLLPGGVVWRHLALQILAGWGCYALMRQYGLGRVAAVSAGLLFAFNGALAWFGHSPPDPAVFLPWLLLGIERSAVQAELKQSGGWRLLAVAVALVWLAGFPETAYICGLFTVAYTIWRWFACDGGARWGFAARVALGGGLGLALAAPQILAFLDFLPQALIGGHDGTLSHAALPPVAALPSLLAPYVFGTINAYSGQWPVLSAVWGNIGGYIDLPLLMLAGCGLACRRDGLAWLLAGWIAASLAKTFGVEPIADLWNLIPGEASTAFYRYAAGSWELAVILLAGFGIDALCRPHRRAPLLAAIGVLVLGAGAGLIYGRQLWPQIAGFAELRHWVAVSAGWALLVSALLVAVIALGDRRWRSHWVGALLVFDAAVMFTIPTMSNPRHGKIDAPAVQFLQRNLGLQRFYTLGPIAPNYGAYFGIAQINHNYLPVPRLWTDWELAQLDPAADAISFTGDYHPDPDQPGTAQELRQHLAMYEEAGVKYVVAPADQNPLLSTVDVPVSDQNNLPLPLAAGQSVRGVVPPGTLDGAGDVDAVSVLIGNYANTADGTLAITLCAGDQCVTGSADLAKSHDNAPFWIALAHAVAFPEHTAISYQITDLNGTRPVALWKFPATAGQSLTGPSGAQTGYGLKLQFRQVRPGLYADQVYRDDLMSVYQLPAPKPYFEALSGACNLVARSRSEVLADCASATNLLRREMFFPGWQARINGKSASITKFENLFQLVKIPAGRSEVAFSYAPPHMVWAWLLLGLAALMMVLSPLFGKTKTP